MHVPIQNSGIDMGDNKLNFAEVRSFIIWSSFRRNCASRNVKRIDGI